jgi:hypothetical protein
MTSILDISAEFNNNLNVSSTLFNVIIPNRTSLFTKFNIFLYVIKIHIYPIQFFSPLYRVNFTFKDLVIFLFLNLIGYLHVSILRRIEEVYLSFFDIWRIRSIISLLLIGRLSSFMMIIRRISDLSCFYLTTIYQNYWVIQSIIFILFIMSEVLVICRKNWLMKLKFSTIQLKIQKLINNMTNCITISWFYLFLS